MKHALLILTTISATLHCMQKPGPASSHDLHHAIAIGNVTQLAQHLQTGMYDINSIDSTGRAPIHAATEYQSIECLRVLLQSGASLVTKTIMNFTALHCAATCNNVTMACMLLDAKPTLIDEADTFGRTALHIAAVTSSLNFAKTLTDRGANLNAVDCSNNTILHFAAASSNEHEQEEVIQHILKVKPALLNAQNNSRETAMHAAAKKRYYPVLKILFTAGADICLQDKDGNTPLHTFLNELLAEDAIHDASRDLAYVILQCKPAWDVTNKQGVACRALIGTMNSRLSLNDRISL